MFVEKKAYEREAWKLVHLLSPYSKKPLRVKDFLGKDEPQGNKMDVLMKRLEKDRAGS